MTTVPNCDLVLLKAVMEGSLDEHSQENVEAHLEHCSACQQKLQQLAGEESDWKKISSYFLAMDLTHPFDGAPTVDIQLVRKGLDSRFDVQEIVDHNAFHADVLEPATHPEMLGRIGTFQIEQMIGKGGMGIVYKGFDTELNRPVAVKVLADHLASNGVARQRFAREARAAAAVIHPNVVPIHSVNSSAQRPYLVMTLVSGRSLQAHVTNHGPMAVREIVRVGKQIAAGLAAAHKEGLVHRDIKPANILLEKDVSRVMITDFGLARAADDAAITQTGWLAGTPHYMSPEQATGKEVDQRSDLFSLGSVLYFMATGREPFRAEIPVAVLQKIASQEIDPIRSINSEMTATLANLISKLMSKDADHRFQYAEDVENVLTQYLAHLEQPRTQPKPRIKLKRKSNSTSKLLVNFLALVVIVGLTVWLTMLLMSPTTPIQENKLTWPEGLQSPAAWQNELDALQNDIESLENSEQLQSNNVYFGLDPISNEQFSIETSIDQLERNLGKSP